MLKKFLVVILLLGIGVSQAQEGTVSPYSFYGIGNLKFKGTAENRAMAGISVYSDSIHLSIQNPAGVANLKLVNYTVGGSHKFETLRTTDQKEQATTTSLDYLAIGVPLSDKFGASFGLIPYTSVGYQLKDESEDGTTEYTGTGGLNKAFLTLAYKITDGLSVGIDANYNFGNIENNATARLNDVQYGTRELNRSDLLGFSYNLGLAYKRMVTDKLMLSTSLTYTPETEFTSENSRVIQTVLETDNGQAIVDSRNIDVSDTNFTFPSQWTLGAGIGQNKKWFVGAEYTDQKTSNFTNRTFDITNVEFKDASKYRIGGFYIPNYNSFGNFWKRVVYRAGFRFEETGINVNGQDINEFGISFGVGIPVGRVFSNVNIGFEVGTRGTKDFGLVQENFFNTYLSLSLNDKWFEKRYFE
ncbi:OmpP1/FadL family transporter [Marinirhabdus gelatinilytica]|uniref:Long-subunit fatty acid transport protein n=1 Tax=Marinirhabdus gelatinilytica TaxID=1703343 RepID=A0A370QL30_9FLAO|nr:outer membrane protein transport protein [Marinirhabdus gelatinilytica]RDK89073.1 long-subunit fatty acid transport protein [Marinirhabdus gelatinilytica]